MTSCYISYVANVKADKATAGAVADRIVVLTQC